MTYSGVDASKWTCARNAVHREYGITIDKDKGEMSQKGFTLQWDYDAGQQTLWIQCTKTPFPFMCGMVNGRIGNVAKECNIA